MTLLPTFIILSLMIVYYYNGHLRSVNTKLAQSVARDVDLIAQTCTMERGNLTALAVIESRLALRFDCAFDLSEDTEGLQTRFAYRDVVQSVFQNQIGRPVAVGVMPGGRMLDVRVFAPEQTLRVEIEKKRVIVINGHIFIVWVVLFSLFMVVTALAFLRNHVRSILKLTEATQGLGRGQDISGFVPSGASEIRTAAQAVIEMAERLTGFTEQRTSMLAGVSHDLRTPLTRLKLYLAMQEQTDDVVEARADVEDMAAMLDEYLAFARGDDVENPENINLSDLVREVGSSFKSANIVVGGVVTVEIVGRPLALKRAISNLVANAISYGTRVELSLTTDGNRTVVIVDDDGDGIPAEQYEAAFQPFTRLNAARTQNVAGTGLGLALSQDVARSHGGAVTLHRSPQGGLRACLALPL
ncbi:MAG: ATP-binding protein [Hyphomonadaceae bacterium]